MGDIIIKLLRMGVGLEDIKISQNTTVSGLKIIIGTTGNIGCFQEIKGEIKKLRSNHILCNNDVLVLVNSKKGEALIRCAGRKWAIHLNDKDNWPSNFHAHDYEKREKLDLLTGEIFSTQNKKYKRNLSEKSHRLLLAELMKYGCYKKKVENVLISLY